MDLTLKQHFLNLNDRNANSEPPETPKNEKWETFPKVFSMDCDFRKI
jgi:hypothetical protein